MSFLHSLFLAGLAAAAIPVLIHLLNRPRARLVRFSTLEFVRKLQIRKSRRLRIRELLLLLLRIALVVLLALAFARPALRGASAGLLRGRARTSACIVLDGSYSMGFTEGGATRMEKAKERARRVVDLLDEGDEAFLLVATDAPERRLDRPTHNFRLLEAEIEKTSPTARGTDLALSVREAARILDESSNPNREIYLITDMQRSGFPAESPRPAAEESRANLFLLPVGEGPRPNRAVTGAELHEPRRFGETVKIRTTVANHSEESSDALVTLVIDGERRGTSSVHLEPGRSESVLFSVFLRERGVHRGEIRIDGDRLPLDDAFYFTVNRPERLEVLLLGRPDEKGLRYLRDALDPEGNGEGLVRVDQADPSEIRTLPLRSYHALFLVGVPSLDAGAVARLEEYLDGGGGIVVVPGDAIDFGSYNTLLLPALFGPVRIGSSIVESRESPLWIDRHDAAHPLFALFRKGLDQALRDVRIVRRLTLETGGALRPVASTSDGAPLLVETKKGAGRAFLWAIGHDESWSDLPSRATYLPLLHEMVRYLYSGGALYKTAIDVGRPYRKDLAGVPLDEEFTCETPFESVILRPRPEGEGITLRFDDTSVPGFYRITGGGLDESFAVNVDVAESNLARASDDEAVHLLPARRVELVPPGRRLERPVMEARYGRELWWELILLALLVAAVELGVARSHRPPLPQD